MFCRIRPFNSVETWRNIFPISVETDKIKIKSLGSKKEFIVDRAFDQNSTQGTLFYLTSQSFFGLFVPVGTNAS